MDGEQPAEGLVIVRGAADGFAQEITAAVSTDILDFLARVVVAAMLHPAITLERRQRVGGRSFE